MDLNLLTSLSDNIRIDREECTACGRCAEICVLDNLRLRLSPCRRACPVGMNCQGYIRLLARKKRDRALGMVREKLPFGGILGRVCSQPCEAKCNRTRVDGQPVAIRDLKRFLADLESRPFIPPVPRELPQKVAIVGAGPAGLTAAFLLRTEGFQVTLYDKESSPGGLMRWAIPEFRLPLEVVERELAFIQAMGIKFMGNRTFGKDLALERVEREFDAVLLALGAHGRTALKIPGEDYPEILPLLEFMKSVRQKNSPRLAGKLVVVIGGGNAAVDAAQAACRLGAKEVRLISLEKKEEMPAFPWTCTEALEEGILIENGWGPKAFHAREGRLAAVTFKRCTGVYNVEGSFSPNFDEQVTMDVPADAAIFAIGQKPSTSLGACDPITLQTHQPRIFAAGDFVTGSRTIVEAMAQGREAAGSIKRFLHGEDLEYDRNDGIPYEFDFEPDLSRAVPRPRVPVRSLPVARRKGFEEVDLGYSEAEALDEAERCLNCGLPVGLRTCWFCLPCEIECPEEALYVEIPFLLR